MLFTDIIADIITGLESGAFEADAEEDSWARGDEDFQEAVNVIAGILAAKLYTKWHLLAVKEHIKQQSDHVRVDEVEQYLEEALLGCGATVGSTLEDYANGNEHTKVGKLYEALDAADGVDRFNWGAYALDGGRPMEGLHFIVMPTPAGDAGVFLFRS